MSDRCSCVDGPSYRCGAGRPCDVHGSVDALMAWGEYVDRRGRPWAIVGFGGEWGLVDKRGFAMGGVLTAPAQMRSRIVREQHREVCPGLAQCEPHPFPMIWRAAKGRWWHGTGWAVNEYPTFAEAIAAAHNMTGEQK